MYMYSLRVSTSPRVSYSPPLHTSLNGHITITHISCAVHSLRSVACYTFLMGQTANFATEMIQVSTKISSRMQKCVASCDIFVSKTRQKVKELFQLFKGTGE